MATTMVRFGEATLHIGRAHGRGYKSALRLDGCVIAHFGSDHGPTKSPETAVRGCTEWLAANPGWARRLGWSA